MAYFMVVPQHISTRTEENQEKLQVRIAKYQARIQTHDLSNI